MQISVAFLLIAMVSLSPAADLSADRAVIWDRDEIPADQIGGNPFNILLQMYSTEPILDSKGEFHDHGHAIQIIQDGGNGIQDPPNSDGTPGGDDLLAVGNFNMIRLLGVTTPYSEDGKSGQFVSWKYFIPGARDAVYYLRLWEGDDIRTAPFYQNSSEYIASGDRGGGMIRISPATIQGPHESDWRFGPSVPRPQKQ